MSNRDKNKHSANPPGRTNPNTTDANNKGLLQWFPFLTSQAFPYLLLSFIFVGFAGLILYDFCSKIVSILVNIGAALAALAFYLSILGIKDLPLLQITIRDKKNKEIISALIMGSIIAAVCAYIICGCFNFRFKIIVDHFPITAETAPASTPSDALPSGESSPFPNSSQPEESESQASLPPEVSEPQISPQPSDIQGGVTDPILVSPNPEIFNDNDIDLKSDFISWLEVDTTIGQTAFSCAEKEFWRSVFKERLEHILNTSTQPDGVAVNVDETFVDHVQSAQQLSNDMRENGVDIKKLEDAINFREQAYALHKTCDLRELLSNDYNSLAQQYAKNNYAIPAVYEKYQSAIEYRLAHIRSLTQVDDNFYYDIYNLASIYQALGDFSKFSTAQRTEASYISACLFELVSQNVFESYCNNCQFTSCYFAGMENHKLLNLTALNSYKTSVEYFQDAYGYYKKCLDGTMDGSLNGEKYLKKNCEYLSQLCVWAQDYISTYGQRSGLLTKAEYKELEKEYLEKSR